MLCVVVLSLIFLSVCITKSKQARCPEIQIENGEIGYMGNREIYHMAYIKKCADGYTFDGSQVAECLPTLRWDNDLRCIKTLPKCPELMTENGEVTYIGGRERYTFAHITCNEGYSIDKDGVETVECLQSLQWENNLNCYKPCDTPTIENGILRSDIFNVKYSKATIKSGQSVSVSCEAGYALYDNKKDDFLEESTWPIKCELGKMTFVPSCKKVCRGTNDGFYMHGTSNAHYDSYKDRYTNCSYVHGNLELTYLKGPYDLGFLSDIEEISGYVFIVNVYSYYLNLTKLRIVRGTELFHYRGVDFSLFVANNYDPFNDTHGLLELQLISLTEISRGKVLFLYNNLLCFENTIRWDDINSLTRTSAPTVRRSAITGRQETVIAGEVHQECVKNACKNFYFEGSCHPYCPRMKMFDPSTHQVVNNPDGRYAFGSLCVKDCPRCEIPQIENSEVSKLNNQSRSALKHGETIKVTCQKGFILSNPHAYGRYDGTHNGSELTLTCTNGTLIGMEGKLNCTAPHSDDVQLYSLSSEKLAAGTVINHGKAIIAEMTCENGDEELDNHIENFQPNEDGNPSQTKVHVQLTCTNGVIPDYDTLSCSAVNCKLNGSIEHGLTVMYKGLIISATAIEAIDHGESAVFNCESGGNEPCDTPAVKNGVLRNFHKKYSKPTIVSGDIVLLQCSQGFFLYDNSKNEFMEEHVFRIKCYRGNITSIPSCKKASRCELPNDPYASYYVNGEIYRGNNTISHKDKVDRVECESGTSLTKPLNGKNRCWDGNWKLGAELPVCEPDPCGLNEENGRHFISINGKEVESEVAHGNKVNVVCDDGDYDIVGNDEDSNSEIQCLKGKFDKMYHCVERCTIPDISNATTTRSNGTHPDKLKHGENVSVSCEDEFIFYDNKKFIEEGSFIMTCASGKIPSIPSCRKGCAIPDIPNANITRTNGKHTDKLKHGENVDDYYLYLDYLDDDSNDAHFNLTCKNGTIGNKKCELSQDSKDQQENMDPKKKPSKL
ncbi:ERBB2-like protein [Mya arenaria]|uniref:ERBB2-like protein n=1 Tax=Mya arenaria TaxID=6604 RepID=A0ABY7GIU0_MYAAR|nr:ERBB2-like protein [Mya arenaria]